MKFSLSNRLAMAIIMSLGLLHAAFFLASNARLLTNFDDIIYLSVFLRQFSESLFSGNFYPRWLMDAYAGSGAPVFVYYPPVAFYISALMTLPARMDPTGVFQLGISMGAALTASALAAYLWLKRHAPVAVSAVIALSFFISPYAITHIHEAMGLAQLWANVWFFLGLICLERWREEENMRFLLGFAAVLALILLTHVPSVLLFWPALGLYGCLLRRPSVGEVLMLAFAFFLALGLSGFYLWPAVANRHFVQIDRYFFRFPATQRPQFFSPDFLLEAVPFAAFALRAIWAVRKNAVPQDLRSVTVMGAAVVLALLFFLTPASGFLWKNFFPLHLLQAPFRFLSLAFVLSPLLLLAVSRSVSVRSLMLMILLVLLLPDTVFAYRYCQRREASEAPLVQSMLREGASLGVVTPEYKTIWMTSNPLSVEYLQDVVRPLPQVAVVSGAAKMAVREWKDGRVGVHVSAARPSVLRLKQHFFPAWEARADGQALHIRSDSSGLMDIDVGAGEHDISVTFSALAGQKQGYWTSLASLLLWCALFFLRFPPRRLDTP